MRRAMGMPPPSSSQKPLLPSQHKRKRIANVHVRPSKEIEGHPRSSPPPPPQQQQPSFFDAQIENIVIPGLPCCTFLTVIEVVGFLFILLYAAAALMEILQQRTFEPVVWASLLSVVVAFDALWFVIYTLSKCRHSRQYKRLADQHWKPSLHHLLIHTLVSTIPMVLAWFIVSYWTAEQFQLLQKRYDATYPVGLDVRLYIQWNLMMFFIFVSLPIEILTWLRAMDRHWAPKYKKSDPVHLLRGLQNLQNKFNPTAASGASQAGGSDNEEEEEEDMV